MKNWKKILSFVYILIFGILFSKNCFAISEPALTILAGDKKIELTENEVINLEGQIEIENFSPILQNQFSASEVIQQFYETVKTQKSQKKVYQHQPQKIYQLLKKLASEINIASTEPSLEIVNNRVVKFSKPQTGQNLNLYKNTLLTLEALEKPVTNIDLKIDQVVPLKKLSNTNNLGINELLAVGESNFKGSPKNRIHNITVGTEKMTGVILQKGEEFSFNKNLGPVEEEAGFLPELVIKKTGTVPELGGGLCQVSSTTFRAAINAGLPITQRKNHSYAVSYYSPQGTDATIYPGVIDLKFINDTPGAILIWPYFKEKNQLVFEFYGTKDDRKIIVEKPVQYDKKSDGSMKAYWNRTVIKDGVEKKDNFNSIYQPPALFHKQEEFVKIPSTP
jgi:vancomycin resistance protein YoaR